MTTPFARQAIFRVTGLLTAMLVVAGLEWLDDVTGPEFGFSLFYLVPVVLTGWLLGPWSAALVSACAALAWFMAELQWRPMDSLSPVLWNAATRLVIFSGMGWLVARLRRDRRRILEANDQLEALLGRESELARTDPVTDLPNWRAFDEVLAREVSRCRRSGQPVCIGYLDLDNFKRVNDRYGHGAGDTLLRKIALALRAALRPEDSLARIGGDEFALLLVGTHEDSLDAMGQRLVDQVRTLGEPYPGTELGASLGLICGLPATRDQETLITMADEAMYRAKRGGKGRVVVQRFGDQAESCPAAPESPDA